MRMSFSNKWLIITVAVLLQLLLTVQAQILDPTSTTKAPVTPSSTTKPPVTTTTTITPPVVIPSVPVSSIITTLSTLVPSVPSTSIIPTSSIIPTTSSALPTTTTTTTTTTSSFSSSVPASSSASSALPSATQTPASSSSSSLGTPAIVGIVVGGVVGLALIGGVLACINRRGGCTKRRDQKKNEFEDYGLGDFPHHRPVASPVAATKPISPTIPRLNDQGNYYNNEANANYGYGYQDNGVDYGTQQQQGYYYPQQHQQQEYYDDGNYYYDNNTSATAYSAAPPMQQHQQGGYVMDNNAPQQHNIVPQDVYKPDEVGTGNATGLHNR